MISTSITGDSTSSTANQLLELLSNPGAYKSKLDALAIAIEENKLYVEAVAPVSEISALLIKTREDRLAAKAALEQATADADAQAEAVAEKEPEPAPEPVPEPVEDRWS